MRGGERFVIYFDKVADDDAYIGNCDKDGNIGNPFGTTMPCFGFVKNRP